MRLRYLPFIAVCGLLAGCAGAFDLVLPDGGSPSSGGATGGGGRGPDAGGGSGLNGSGGSGGAASGGTGGAGAPCTPGAPGACSQGLLCDPASDLCRLPGYGEVCVPDAGDCATEPANMTCEPATFDGVSQQLCLVSCSAADSSGCPYGTSCGDPNLPGYCSPQGSGTCTAWSACALGGGIQGLCVPSGKGTACLATGIVDQPFAPCDPEASNASTSTLCGGGMLCIPSSQAPVTLRASLAGQSGGNCFPLCGPGAPGCGQSQHCYQPPGADYGTCLPGAPCVAGESHCQIPDWCLPDGLASPMGGCVASGGDAGAPGSPCALPASLGEPYACTAGAACLPDGSGGATCQTLCELDAGGCGYGESCAPAADAGAVLGSCR
ncbi:MAG: hypothetical protein ACYDCL_06350 [Myxococcales bacterium]